VPAWRRHGAQSVAWAGARHTKPQAEAEKDISYILSYNVRLRHKGREKEEEIQHNDKLFFACKKYFSASSPKAPDHAPKKRLTILSIMLNLFAHNG
jgi:hypothetical protein